MDLIDHWPAWGRIALAAGVALVAFPLANLAAGAIRRGVRRAADTSPVDSTLVAFGAEVARAALLVGALVLTLTLAGVEATSLATVLGAATLAVGLAMQSTLANVAAGVLILVFRKYLVGEFVEAAGKQGSVRTVGLFATELQTPSGLMVMVPNAKVFAEPMTNFSRHAKRRVDVDVTLAWDCDLQAVQDAALAAVKAHPKALTEPAAEAVIAKMTDRGPQLSARVWVDQADAARVGWDLNAAVLAALSKAGARFASPA